MMCLQAAQLGQVGRKQGHDWKEVIVVGHVAMHRRMCHIYGVRSSSEFEGS